MVTLVTFCSLVNSYSRWKSEAAFGLRADKTTIEHDPIFVIGHWRTGTTFLHELLVQDAQFSFPTTFQCMSPHHFLRTEPYITSYSGRLLPKRRVMDNMDFGWHHPQEDEFALCNLGLPSPYLYWGFPDRHEESVQALSLDALSAADRQQWLDGFEWFTKRLTFNDPRQLVLKSPPHTARIKLILELYPNAKFIHLVRHPVSIIPSTIRTWKQMGKACELYPRRNKDLEGLAYDQLRELYRAYWRDEGQLTDDQLCQVRYEDLTADPIGQAKRIYQTLNLDGFSSALRHFEAHLAKKQGYRKNRFDLKPALRDRIEENCREYSERYGYVKSTVDRPRAPTLSQTS